MTVEDHEEPGSLFPGIKGLVDLYADLDRESSRFQEAVGLTCLKGCRRCCTPARAQIEASVFECLPLSLRLWNRGEAETLRRGIAAGAGENLCLLYHPEESPGSAGGCAQYAWRPLLCRLFGFSAVLDKHGRPRIALCQALKEADPDAEDRVKREISRGVPPLIIPHWAAKAVSLNPHLGQKRYPLNQALKIALERVGFGLDLLRSHSALPGEKGADALGPGPRAQGCGNIGLDVLWP